MIFTFRGWLFLLASAAYGGAANAYFAGSRAAMPGAMMHGAILGLASTLVTIIILANMADPAGRARLIKG
jgi:hypothetical protein